MLHLLRKWFTKTRNPKQNTFTTMDTKGENIARPELRPQAEAHALVVPVSLKRAERRKRRLA